MSMLPPIIEPEELIDLVDKHATSKLEIEKLQKELATLRAKAEAYDDATEVWGIFKGGELKAIKAYSYTIARVNGTNMTFGGYTYIKPHPKYGTFGYNVGVITLMMQNAVSGGYDVSLSSSMVPDIDINLLSIKLSNGSTISLVLYS